tara:strand:- start:129 stop:455 length:327 start_codon:yes stop_codon:yes gene_type:complete
MDKKGSGSMTEEELKELNHEEAQMAEELDDLMDMWSFSHAMKIMDEVVSTLEKAGFVNEENKTDVKEVLYQFGNRIRDFTLDSNYIYTMRSQYQWYFDNDRKRLEGKE